MRFQSSFKQYLKWLIGSYLAIGILLAFNSKLILDFSLSTFLLVGPFVLCTVAYGVLTLNKKYITSYFLIKVASFFRFLVLFSMLLSLYILYVPNGERLWKRQKQNKCNNEA